MDTLRRSYYQCTACGEIHYADVGKVIDLDDDIYYITRCPKCRDFSKHLCLGDEDDVYMYYDNVLDARFYDYKTK